MPSQNLIRSRGFALLAAGVLLALFFLLHPGGGDPPTLEAARHPLYFVEHLFGVASLSLLLFGLDGVRERLSSRMGMLGATGFSLAFLGSALLLGVVYFDGYASPILAANAPQLLAASGPFATLPGFLPQTLAGVIWGMGLIALAIAAIRAGMLPRWASWLLIVGTVAVNLPQQRMGPASLLVIALGAVAMGGGMAWWGYAIWLGS